MTGPTEERDHGGGLDAAAAKFGGQRADWLDLSTGINPTSYPLGAVAPEVWRALPDQGAMDRLLAAARGFWNVPPELEIVAAPGVSALIARLPSLGVSGSVYIPGPTYNEHAAAFAAHGHRVDSKSESHPMHVYVHPNNPDGRHWPGSIFADRALTIIDESFCDTDLDASHMANADRPGVIILKGLGKFWGLGGLRLGFAIARKDTLAPKGRPALRDLLGPWPVSGPALEIGTAALKDLRWAQDTRRRLREDAARLDDMMLSAGAEIVGGTTLFRTYHLDDGAARWQDRLAQHRIWTRTFPYSDTWMRLGLPGSGRDWARLEAAL